MDKSLYYRQSAIVFLLLFFSLVAIGIYEITYIQWLWTLEIIIIAVTVIYVFVSSIRINKK